MKIVVINHADVRVEVLDIPNTMLNETCRAVSNGTRLFVEQYLMDGCPH